MTAERGLQQLHLHRCSSLSQGRRAGHQLGESGPVTEITRLSIRQRQLGPRDRRDVADILEDLRQDVVRLDRVVRSHGQAIAKSEKIAALETTMEAYRNVCATMEVKVSKLDAYAQAVDQRLTDVLNKATF